jgi:hypothetical protein
MKNNYRNTFEERKVERISRRSFLGLAGLGFYATAQAFGAEGYNPIQNGLETNLQKDLKLIRDKVESDKLEAFQNYQKELVLKEEIRKKEELRRMEFEEPGRFSFEKASDHLILAKTIFAESEEAWKDPNYMGYVGVTPIMRSYLSGDSLRELLLYKVERNGINTYAYDVFNPSNPRSKVIANPLLKADRFPEKKLAWEKAYVTAEYLLGLHPDKINPKLTHFYVDTVAQPEWSKGRKPVKTIALNGKTTRFYYIPKDFC